jgi:hypothetical protein
VPQTPADGAASSPSADSPPDSHLGAIASIGLLVVLLAFAVTVDFPKAAHGYKGDEATYYSLAHSLARDFDFTFERKDLIRIWEEFPGPEGIFLKRGKVASLRRSPTFPFLRWRKVDDPVRTRLYYAKSYIYPLAAAPFVFLFGTNGFLVLHALMLSLDLFAACTFLSAFARSPRAAVAYAIVFIAASVVPVHVVWLIPELFNFSVVLYAFFLWTYKEVATELPQSWWGRFLRGQGSDYAAALLLGVVTFSKLTHAVLMLPLCALAILRRRWWHAAAMALAWTLMTGALFGGNAAISGEFNYQGGDRKTFYSFTGFPFANDRETFESINPTDRREAVLPTSVLWNRHTLTVFRYNLVYFVFGRFSGFLPYFFPGLLSLLLFLAVPRRQLWQWLIVATIGVAVVTLLLLTPFTYSGGGGPVGNRYFFSFYPLFLFLTPAVRGFGSAFVALVVGALFTAKIVLNPFYSSFNPGEHAKSGPLRWLPIELTLLNDLPVAAHADRSKRLLGGSPPVLAYFPDDNAYDPEGDAFWVKGKSRTEVILRAPVAPAGNNRFVTKAITNLMVEVQNGARLDRVTVSTGRESRTLVMQPAELARLNLAVEAGVPYHRQEQPTSFVYVVSIATTSGFLPFLEAPGASDSRFLGARIRLVPDYVDSETTVWSPETLDK